MKPEQYSLVCRELILVCRDMAATMHSQVSPLCRQSGLTVQQFYVLSELRDNPQQRITQICERIGIQRTNFAIISKKLEGRGLVERVQSPHDRRAFSLVITEQGEHALDSVNHAIEKQFRNSFGEIPDETIEALLHGVRELRLGCGKLR